MPRRWAAAAPSTQTGSWAVAAFRKVPSASVVPTAPGRPRLVAATEMALVSIEGMRGLRKVLAFDTAPVYWTSVTGPMRPIIPGASVGSSAVWPKSVWPLVTVSRFVPSLLISANSPACEEAESPSTATIAATPMAMPSAERPARSLRVRSPMLASLARSAGPRCAGASAPALIAEPLELCPLQLALRRRRRPCRRGSRPPGSSLPPLPCRG